MSQKLSTEELTKFQSVRKEIYETISILGDLNYRKTLLDLELDNLREVIKKNAIAEKALLKEFGQKYGDGSINVETGDITSI